jgi:copper chaperone CopZ
MKDAVFKTYVRGIYCVECPEKIIFGLLQTRGVVDADVAYFQSLVTVKYDPALVSEETLRAVLEELGYPAFERKPTVLERMAAKLKHLGGSA